MDPKPFIYAVVKTLYDQGKDYIDAFWPFAVSALEKLQKPSTVEEIQNQIEDLFNFKIPLHSLVSILTRAKRNRYVDQANKLYSLTEKNLQDSKKSPSNIDIQRSLNQLFKYISEFMNGKGLKITEERAESLLLDLVQKQTELLERYLLPTLNNSKTQPNILLASKELSLLVDCLEQIYHYEPTLCNTLEEVIRGTIISLSLQSDDISKATESFSATTIFMDSNFLFSVLNLHHDVYNRPAKELLTLLRSQKKLTLKVFDFTLNEMTSVLNAYSTNQHHYIRFIPVDSIYSSLKVLSWTASTARRYIATIEEELYKLNINVEYTGIDLAKYVPEDTQAANTLRTYKSQDTPHFSIIHDLLAIELVQKYRRKVQYKLEHAGAFFLTSDLKLSKFNLHYANRAKAGTIAEVIPDRVLTNILWLKNPKQINKIKLSNIIALYRHDLFVNRKIWEYFLSLLQQEKNAGKIDDSSIGLLLYDNHTKDLLLEASKQEKPELITRESLESLVSSARNQEQQKLQTKIKEIEEQKLQEAKKLLEPENQTLKTQNEKWRQQLLDIKNKLRKNSKTQAIILTVFLIIILTALLYIFLSKNMARIVVYEVLLIFVLWILDKFFPKLKLFKIVEVIENYLYKKKLSNIGLAIEKDLDLKP